MVHRHQIPSRCAIRSFRRCISMLHGRIHPSAKIQRTENEWIYQVLPTTSPSAYLIEKSCEETHCLAVGGIAVPCCIVVAIRLLDETAVFVSDTLNGPG